MDMFGCSKVYITFLKHLQKTIRKIINFVLAKKTYMVIHAAKILINAPFVLSMQFPKRIPNDHLQTPFTVRPIVCATYSQVANHLGLYGLEF